MKPVIYRDLSPAMKRHVREAYIAEQGGKCCHCKAELKGKPSSSISSLSINEGLFPRGFFTHPVHLHHSHDTGLTIGAVHAKCNAVLWQYHKE